MTDKLKALADRLRLGASISRERNLNLDYAAVADEAADAILALIKRAEDAEAIAFQWQNAAIDVTQKHDALQARVNAMEGHDEVSVYRLMKKEQGIWVAASEYFTGAPDADWVDLVAKEPAMWSIQRRVTGKQIADGIAKAIAPGAEPTEPRLQWCETCGEGVIDFCRGKGIACPYGFKRPGAAPKPITDEELEALFCEITGLETGINPAAADTKRALVWFKKGYRIAPGAAPKGEQV